MHNKNYINNNNSNNNNNNNNNYNNNTTNNNNKINKSSQKMNFFFNIQTKKYIFLIMIHNKRFKYQDQGLLQKDKKFNQLKKFK